MLITLIGTQSYIKRKSLCLVSKALSNLPLIRLISSVNAFKIFIQDNLTTYICYACNNFILFLTNGVIMNIVETYVHNNVWGYTEILPKRKLFSKKALAVPFVLC